MTSQYCDGFRSICSFLIISSFLIRHHEIEEHPDAWSDYDHEQKHEYNQL